MSGEGGEGGKDEKHISRWSEHELLMYTATSSCVHTLITRNFSLKHSAVRMVNGCCCETHQDQRNVPRMGD